MLRAKTQIYQRLEEEMGKNRRLRTLQKPEDYPHSSYRLYLSGKGDNLVSPEVVVQLVGGGKSDGSKRYRSFVESGMNRGLENPAAESYGGLILGGTEFIKDTLRKLKAEHLGKAEISHRFSLCLFQIRKVFFVVSFPKEDVAPLVATTLWVLSACLPSRLCNIRVHSRRQF
jgi:hypothetical protein